MRSRSSNNFLLQKHGFGAPSSLPTDVAPCDFVVLPKMKSQLQKCCFQDIPEMQEKLLTVLHVIPKSQFQQCFQQRQKHWTHCINSEGDCYMG